MRLFLREAAGLVSGAMVNKTTSHVPQCKVDSLNKLLRYFYLCVTFLRDVISHQNKAAASFNSLMRCTLNNIIFIVV